MLLCVMREVPMCRCHFDCSSWVQIPPLDGVECPSILTSHSSSNMSLFLLLRASVFMAEILPRLKLGKCVCHLLFVAVVVVRKK